MTSALSRTALTALSLPLLTLGAPALGQEAPGREGQLSYSVGLDYDFDVGLEAISDVALTLTTRTQAQSLAFSIGTELFGDYTDGGTDEFDFRNSFVRADYTRTGANSRLEFSAGYAETNLDDTVVDTVIADGGTLKTTSFDARLETGIDAPLGLTFDASYRDRDYQDTTDPDLTDDTRTSADVLARFALSQAMTLRARAGIENVDKKDAAEIDTETVYAGLGLETATARGLTVRGDLLFDRVKETTGAPATSTTEDGVGFEIELEQDRPDGSLGALVSSRISDLGRTTRAEVSRNIETRTGGIAFSLGAADLEDVSELQLIGSLSYEQETPRGALTASLTQDAVSDDGDPVLSTGLEVAYRQEINAISSWEASLGYFATDDLNGGEDDNRTTASVSYIRDFTPEWSMRTGYNYSRDQGEDASNSVFFTLERDITFGF